MNTIYKMPDKGDPSDVLQLFPKYNLQLLCCRYWLLENWEFRELSYPYWRIYINDQPGASIKHNNTTVNLSPDKFIVIAPNTSYSSQLFDNAIPVSGYCLNGQRLNYENIESESKSKNTIQHLFLHFNLGIPYDNISPGIYEFSLTSHLKDKLTIIKQHLMVENAHFNFYTVLTIHSLISDLLSKIPGNNWDLLSNDYRIIDVLNFIENNLDSNLSNEILAEKTHLATNAFTRLFKQEVGFPPQQYVKKKKIDKACVLLHHFDFSIEKISKDTGFADRYHFSKIFKHVTGLSPAKYRKEFVVS